MVFVAAEILGILMRWAHIASAVLLVGGMAYARAVAFPAYDKEAGEERLSAFQVLASRYRPIVYAAVVGLLISGLYNFLTHPGHTRYYHAWFGVKILLALHVFASAVLAVRPAATAAEESKRNRRMASVVVSGMLILLISAYLRRIY